MDGGPLRTCVGCRRKRLQAEMLRVVRGADGAVSVDAAPRSPGRGAYLCRDAACVTRAVGSGALRRALRCDELPAGIEPELLEAAGEGNR